MSGSTPGPVKKPANRGGRLGPWLLRNAARLACGLVLFLPTAWAMAALYIDVRTPWLRGPLAVGYILAILGAWIMARSRWVAVGITVGGFVVVLGWWLTLQPSNDREWQPDLAVLPYAEIEGSRLTMHHIRNCDYRTERDFDVRHYDKTFDLDKLRSADLYTVYWGSPYMAHAMVSFGFEGGDQLCFSIETRKEKGEDYSAVKGLFRQFEIIYVVADERDVVRLRTNYRQGEEVYLYRLNGSAERLLRFFMGYINRVNSLHDRAEWYNAVTENCSTAIRLQQAAADRPPWNWRMLVNGYGDTLLYEREVIATNLPFAELKERSHINERARAADKAVDFSRLIRQDLTVPNRP